MSLTNATTEAISHLVAQQPFFAVYLFDQMKIKETDQVPTAATDGQTVYINPEFFAGLQLPERVFVIAHEVMHGIFHHMARGKGYSDRGFGPDLKPWSHMRYNKAADYIINDMLHTAKVGRLPSMALHDPAIATEHDLADEVYVTLPDEEDNGQGTGNFDEHLEPDPNAKQPSEADTKRALAAAKNAAKAMGKMPANLERIVGGIIEPALDWKDMLRNMMTAGAGRDASTWSRPNRRRIATPPHVYWPGTTGFATGGVAIVVDTSGSISPDELKQFMSEVSGILSECRPEWCKVLWTDSQVAHVDEVDDMTDIASLKAHGGGGTNMEAAFQYMDDENIWPDTCVVLTDGYTSFTESMAPEYDVIWGITNDKIVAPYGKSLFIDVR